MIEKLRHTLQQRWRVLSAREQRGLMVVGGLLMVLLAWQVLIAPAQNKLRQADAQRQVVAQQLARMQALQTQAQALQQRTPMSREGALRALQGLTLPLGIQINPQGERVLVTLKGVPANVLSNWLALVRTQAQALPSEVHLTRTSVNPVGSNPVNNAATQTSPTWDGSLVLVLPRGAMASSS